MMDYSEDENTNFQMQQHDRLGRVIKLAIAEHSDAKPRGIRDLSFIYHRHEKRGALRLSRVQLAQVLISLEKTYKISLNVFNGGARDPMPPRELNQKDITFNDVRNYIYRALLKYDLVLSRTGRAYKNDRYHAQDRKNKEVEESTQETSTVTNTKDDDGIQSHKFYETPIGPYVVVSYKEPSLHSYIVSIQAVDGPEFFVYEEYNKDGHNHIYLCDTVSVATLYDVEDMLNMFGDWQENALDIKNDEKEPITFVLNDFIERAHSEGAGVTIRFIEVVTASKSNEVYEFEFDVEVEVEEEGNAPEPDIMDRIKQKLTEEEFYHIASMRHAK